MTISLINAMCDVYYIVMYVLPMLLDYSLI